MNNGSPEDLLDYCPLLFQLVFKGEGLVWHLNLGNYGIVNNLPYIFRHGLSSAEENHPIILENVLLKPLNIVLEEVLNINLICWVFPALGDIQLNYLLLL